MSSYRKLVLFDIDYTLFDTESFKKSNLSKFELFEETLDVIVGIKKFADVGILSEGEAEFQKAKLSRTKLAKHLIESNIHIVDSKDLSLEEVLSKYKTRKIFLVDDKLNILQIAKKLIPDIFTIWIKRGPYTDKQKPIVGFNPDTSVEDLREVVEIVKNND